MVFPITPAELRSLLRRLASRAALVVPQLPAPVPVRDPLDEHFLALALIGRADFLVTGNDDLLTLAGDPRLGNLEIVTVAALLAVPRAHTSEREAES